ncbi:ComF family protein [Cytobacillus sp. Hm23]
MFIKNNDINCFILHTSQFSNTEIEIIKNDFGHLSIVYLIPYDQETPSYVSSYDLQIKEGTMELLFGYKNLLQQIVNLTKVPSCETIFISKDKEKIKQTLSLPIGTLLISSNKVDFEDVGKFPDLKVENVKDIKDQLTWGFFSEICLTFVEKGNKTKNLSGSGITFAFGYEREDTRFDVIAAGRYFQPGHECFNIHQLSHRIKKSKKDTSQNKLFTEIYNAIIKREIESTKIHGITRVPNRPSNIDRQKNIVKVLAEKNSLEDLSDALICPKDYNTHKLLNSEQRFENVKNKFQVTKNVYGKNIIIIDDVFTTGATSFECARQLYDAGAEKVTVIVIGVNQFLSSEFIPQREIKCESCGGKMYLRFNGKNQVGFYGCENWRHKEHRCDRTDEYLPAWKRINENYSLYPQNDEEDFLF